MPYTSTNPTDTEEDGKVQLGEELDGLVAGGRMTPEDALEIAQGRGLTTGPGPNSYQPPNAPTSDPARDARLNADSAASARRSAAYQANRADDPEGFGTKADEESFYAMHPLSEYEDE